MDIGAIIALVLANWELIGLAVAALVAVIQAWQKDDYATALREVVTVIEKTDAADVKAEIADRRNTTINKMVADLFDKAKARLEASRSLDKR